MKKLVTIMLIGFSFCSSAQKIKETKQNQTEIETLLKNGIKPELAFFWETKDTLIVARTNFRETIQFDLINKKCIIRNTFSEQEIQLTKDFKLNDRTTLDSQRDFEYNFDIIGNVFIVAEMYQYKIYFDKKKQNILKIENINDKHVFIPKEYEYYMSPVAPVSSGPND